MLPGLAAPAALAQRLVVTGPDGALVLLDLDRSSAAARSESPAARDLLLRSVERALEDRVGSLTSGGAVSRLAGDEFAVVLDGVTAGTELTIARELSGIVTSVSGRVTGCGAVPVRRDSDGRVDVGRSFRDVGLALRAARLAGPGAVSGLPDIATVLTLAEEEDLDVRTMFRSGGLELFFQPLIDPVQRRPVGLEALVRARDATGALIAPGAFLPQVRRSGFSADLGTAVLTEALEAWRAGLRTELVVAGAGPALLTVNFDGEQVEQDGFDVLVLYLLDRAGMPPDELVLEVTESVLDDAAARGRLQRLRDAGVKVAIDDFGAGPLVLSEIRELPVDILKVDQVLVGRLDPAALDMTLIEDLQRLAGLLGLRLAVEAVEGAPLAERIAALGVALAQGYHYARPLPPAEVVAWLRAGVVSGAATPGEWGGEGRGTGRQGPV